MSVYVATQLSILCLTLYVSRSKLKTNVTHTIPEMPINIDDFTQSTILENISMNKRKEHPTYRPGPRISKTCGVDRDLVLVNKSNYHVKFFIKKVPWCKCFMSAIKIALPSGAGIEGSFEHNNEDEIQEVTLAPMTDAYIDHVIQTLQSRHVLVTLEMDGKIIFTNRKMGAYDKYTCRDHLILRV